MSRCSQDGGVHGTARYMPETPAEAFALGLTLVLSDMAKPFRGIGRRAKRFASLTRLPLALWRCRVTRTHRS